MTWIPRFSNVFNDTHGVGNTQVQIWCLSRDKTSTISPSASEEKKRRFVKTVSGPPGCIWCIWRICSLRASNQRFQNHCNDQKKKTAVVSCGVAVVQKVSHLEGKTVNCKLVNGARMVTSWPMDHVHTLTPMKTETKSAKSSSYWLVTIDTNTKLY